MTVRCPKTGRFLPSPPPPAPSLTERAAEQLLPTLAGCTTSAKWVIVGWALAQVQRIIEGVM